jgi:hypothetical protein
MPDALEQLQQFARDTIKEFLREMPPDELLAALSPEARAALAQRLKDNGSPANLSRGESETDQRKPS